MPSFCASIGTKILLEVEGNLKRFICILVGYSKDRFILVTTPSSEHLFSARPALFADCRVNVRYIEDGRAIGFQSRLMKSTEEPARLLFLSYPEKIEDHELRANKRAACSLPAELSIEGEACSALIIDINKDGLRLHVKGNEKFSGFLEPTPVGKECILRFFLPGVSAPIDVVGEVRNHEHRETCSAVGIKYIKISDEDRQSIFEFELKLET